MTSTIQKVSDKEIFLSGIEFSKKTPHVSYTDMQVGKLKGFMVGALMIRDKLSLKEAIVASESINEEYYNKWVRGEVRNESSAEGLSAGALLSVEESLDITTNEKTLIEKAMKKHRGKRKDAAKELGLSERTLYRKLKEHNIQE